jgi:hypothetical protein
LTIDELHRSSPKGRKIESKSIEFGISDLGNEPNYYIFSKTIGIEKALSDTIPCPRPGNDKFHLGEGDQRAVVEIDRQLERKEVTERRVAP